MEDHVEVDGAWIERSYLEDNVAEATEMSWRLAALPNQDKHSHCLICWKALPSELKPQEAVFSSDGGWLCGYCHRRFILPQDSAESQ